MKEIHNSFYKEKYYFNDMAILDIFRFVRYIQFKGEYILGLFMKKRVFHTKYIDLTPCKEKIKSSFSKTVKYEINRAKKDGVTFHIYELDNTNRIDSYINYYNDFAKSKKLNFNISKRNIVPFLDNTLITFVEFDDVILSMHRYILDEESKTVHLMESSSHFRTLDSDDGTINRNFIGRANRFLHYEDMLYFKNIGFDSYDFGGYGVDTQNNSILQINKFKDGFRGELVQENHFESYPFLFLKICYRLIKRS